MGKYITTDGVKQRLGQKVRFTTDPTADGEDNKMPVALLNRLISEAESQVELDLSERYWVPFQGVSGQPFASLAQNTVLVLTTLCYIQAVAKVLETDFGSGTVTDASKYVERMEKRYAKILEQLLGRRKKGGEETGRWKYPPLQDLRLAYMNEEADTGFAGMVLNTTTQTVDGGGFPLLQINDPNQNFINNIIDDLE